MSAVSRIAEVLSSAGLKFKFNARKMMFYVDDKISDEVADEVKRVGGVVAGRWVRVSPAEMASREPSGPLPELPQGVLAEDAGDVYRVKIVADMGVEEADKVLAALKAAAKRVEFTQDGVVWIVPKAAEQMRAEPQKAKQLETEQPKAEQSKAEPQKAEQPQRAEPQQTEPPEAAAARYLIHCVESRGEMLCVSVRGIRGVRLRREGEKWAVKAVF